MRKRAALIRTLVYDPPMILMDEPFAAVDAQTRTQLQEDLLRLWSLKRKTIIFVTHDITEAIALGDRALVLTQRPARIAAEHPIPIPRPRNVKDIFTHAGLRRDLRTHPGGRAMSSADITSDLPETRAIPRQWIVTGGQVLLRPRAARRLGVGRARVRPAVLRAAARHRAAHRRDGDERQAPDRHRSRRLRVSALGFVIGCVCGVGLPFLLRLSERATQAIEPFIMASMGIPKYALTPWLILWFGIGDAPKVIVVTLFVFYIVFITVFAGVRGVDQRLVNMARVIGASERAIARKVIWVSLLPFFFTGLKVALPRAVSAAIVGEFLVATEGVGFSIERARQLSDTTGVFAGIVVAVALVLLINAVVNALERHALKWRPTDRDMQM